MGKQALTAVLEDILKETQKYREGVVDTYEHVYPVDSKKITEQVKKAINTIDHKINTNRIVASEVKIYTKELYDRFNRLVKTSRTAKYVIVGTSDNFVVRCSSIGGQQNDIFSRINEVRTGSLGKVPFKQPPNWSNLSPEEQRMMKDTFNKLTGVSPLSRLRQRLLLRLFDISLEDIDISKDSKTLDVVLGAKYVDENSGEYVRRGGLLHLGHLDGFAVIERRAAAITSLIKERTGIDIAKATISKSIRNRRKFKLHGDFAEITLDLDLEKETTVVTDEFAGVNISKVFEKNILPQITKAFLTRKNWHKYPGSITIENALLDDGTQDMMDSISKSFPNSKNLKVKVNRSKNTESRAPSKSKPISVKATGTKTKTKGEGENFYSSNKSSSTPGSINKKPSQQNWSSLLPMLNNRLPPRVMANMRSPALVNRTGTFANSAQIVTVESTKSGLPTFVFDYERNPYNVFDRILGRSPWNTPERDPRALVDKSVRELVREMAIGRFYTRRA